MRANERYWHVLGWAVYLLYVLIGEYFHFIPGRHSVLTFSFLFINMIEFYFLYLWVYPRFLKSQTIFKLIVGIITALIGFIVLRYFIEEVAFLYLFHIHNYGAGTTIPYYIFDNIYFGASAILVSAAVYIGFAALYKEQENKSLREEKIQAELAFLKSQVNPHFLYNTLNYIYSLAYPVSDKLANAIIKLSALMRYMLHESGTATVQIQKEIDYLNNYIEVYRLRFESRFFVNFQTHINARSPMIASLILIPFVENAFKHGIVDDPECPVMIDLNFTEKGLYFSVVNQINQNQKDISGGVGLTNIRRRLELIYPGAHELTIIATGGIYKTILTINYDTLSGR
jgi:two-component system LytT family sensor kinase